MIYRLDVPAGSIQRYGYQLPNPQTGWPSVAYDREYIWLYRNQEIMVMDQKDGALRIFPLPEKETFQAFRQEGELVYLLYAHKVVVYRKSAFVAACRFFDTQNYNHELQTFIRIRDSLQLGQDTLLEPALAKWNFLQQRFGASAHPEVVQGLSYSMRTAFSGVKNTDVDTLRARICDTRLPEGYRRSCWASLLERLIEQRKFEEALAFYEQFEQMLGDTGRNPIDPTDMEPIRTYLHRIDSLDRQPLAPDSLAYHQAMALKPVCQTRWFTGEACYHYDILQQALQRFMARFPASKLIDNAAYIILETTDCWEGGASDEEIAKYIVPPLEKFLRTYSDTDLRADVLYELYQAYAGMNEPDAQKMNHAAKRFKSEFPEDPRGREMK